MLPSVLLVEVQNLLQQFATAMEMFTLAPRMETDSQQHRLAVPDALVDPKCLVQKGDILLADDKPKDAFAAYVDAREYVHIWRVIAHELSKCRRRSAEIFFYKSVTEGYIFPDHSIFKGPFPN